MLIVEIRAMPAEAVAALGTPSVGAAAMIAKRAGYIATTLTEVVRQRVHRHWCIDLWTIKDATSCTGMERSSREAV
jgi:hypothetical protein